jgi:uncharacterized membrane protein YdjX (TVP38/TMEM64 family)
MVRGADFDRPPGRSDAIHVRSCSLSPPEKQQRSLRTAKIAVVLLVVAILVVAQRLGIFHQLDSPAHVRETLVALGPWGYVAFIVAYALLQPFGIPGTVFVMAAPLIWPWPIAFGLSMIGTMTASVIGFSFARFVARDWIVSIIPERFRRYEDRLAKRELTTVIVLRLIFWMPPLLHAFFGVSKVRFWNHFWGSFIGYLLPLFLMSFFGQRLFDLLKDVPLRTWLLAAGGALVVGLTILMIRRRRRAQREAR